MCKPPLKLSLQVADDNIKTANQADEVQRVRPVKSTVAAGSSQREFGSDVRLARLRVTWGNLQ